MLASVALCCAVYASDYTRLARGLAEKVHGRRRWACHLYEPMPESPPMCHEVLVCICLPAGLVQCQRFGLDNS